MQHQISLFCQHCPPDVSPTDYVINYATHSLSLCAKHAALLCTTNKVTPIEVLVTW